MILEDGCDGTSRGEEGVSHRYAEKGGKKEGRKR